MDALQQLDAGIFSTLNGFHAYYFDSFMYLVTKIIICVLDLQKLI